MRTEQKEMSVTYPHRLTFLERGKCDVCGNKGKELVHTNANRYFGWETCNQGPCNDMIQTWYHQTTIANDDLCRQFGNRMRIKRRSGDMENDWEISGDAHVETKGGPYWVKVKHLGQHTTKEVTVESLKDWNP
jgi:hypothetical protein